MGQIGRYKYPDIGPEQAASIVRTIKNNIGDTIETSDRENLAKLLGHDDADSGAFKQKLTTLKRYGLLKGRGTLQTTDLATRVLNDRAEAYREMLDNVQLLNNAFNRFDGDPVEPSEWESFLEEQTGTDDGVDDIPEANRLRKIYLEFVQLIPEDRTPGSPDDLLDEERDFNYYVEKLENPNTREPALEALGERLANKRLPDAEPLDRIIEFIQTNPYPEYHSDFFRLLQYICRQNDLDRVNSGRREEVIELMYDKMDDYSTPEHIEEERDSLTYVMNTLESLYPDDLVERWWTLLLERVEEGHVVQSDSVRKFAINDLRKRLMKQNAEIRDEFFHELADDAEDTLWELMAETDDEDLRDDYEYLLGRMGVF